MYLRNFERSWPSGEPISGATVVIYPASLVDVHVAPVTFTDHNGVSGTSTQTNSYGLWAAVDLPDGAFYDVRVEYNSKVKWYFGRTMHGVEHLYDDKTAPLNRNILRNGGMSGWAAWTRRGSSSVAISTSQVEIADYWNANVSGGGDSATGTRANASGIASQYVSEISYTRVGGNLTYRQVLTGSAARGLQSKVISVTFAIWQNGNARVKPFITDSAGTSYGSVLTGTSSWNVVTVTRTIDAAATSLEIGWVTDTPSAGTYTIRATMALADYGSTLPVYTVMPFDAGLTTTESDRFLGPYTIDDTQVLSANLGYNSEVNNSLARRVKEIIGASSGTWLSTVPRTLTQLLADVIAAAAAAATAQSTANTGVANAATAQSTANTALSDASTAQTTANAKVTKSGDTMSGALNLQASSASVALIGIWNQASGSSGIGLGILNQLASGFDFIITHLEAVFGVTVSAPDFTVGGVSVRARANHTGTQAPATISPQGAGSGLDADTLDGHESTYYTTSVSPISGSNTTFSPTTSYTDISGTTLTLTTPGKWQIIAKTIMRQSSGDGTLTFALNVVGLGIVDSVDLAVSAGYAPGTVICTLTSTGSTQVKCQGKKASGGSASTLDVTSIIATYCAN